MDDKKNKTVVHPCNRMLLTYCAKINTWKRRNFKCILLSEISQFDKTTHCRFQVYDILENSLRLWNYRVREKKDLYLGKGQRMNKGAQGV